MTDSSGFIEAGAIVDSLGECTIDTANQITSILLDSIMVRKVVVRRHSRVNRIMITERCGCGHAILKGMVRCPGCGRDANNHLRSRLNGG